MPNHTIGSNIALLGYMKRVFTILGLWIGIISVAVATSDVTGVVLDAESGEPLTYATLALSNGAYGVITDEDGTYRLEINDLEMSDTVIISYVGYTSRVRTIAQLQEDGSCQLFPYGLTIDEVVITPLDVEEILRKSYDKFYNNHVHRDMATYGYYREQLFEGDACVRYGEAVFSTRFYEEKGEDMAAMEPYLARSIDDSTFLKKLNGLFNKRRMLIPIGMDGYVENNTVNGFKVDQYYEWVGEFFFGDGKNGFDIEYTLQESTDLFGRENYYIIFDVSKKRADVARGKLLIDKETHGIAAFEIKLNEQENLVRILIPTRFRLLMKIFGYGIDIDGFEAKLYNRYDNGKWFIGRGLQVLQGGIAKRGEWIRGKVHNEFHAFYSSVYQEQDKERKFEDLRTYDFGNDFWEGFSYSPMQPKQKAYIRQIQANNKRFEGEVLSERVKRKLAAKKE